MRSSYLTWCSESLESSIIHHCMDPNLLKLAPKCVNLSRNWYLYNLVLEDPSCIAFWISFSYLVIVMVVIVPNAMRVFRGYHGNCIRTNVSDVNVAVFRVNCSACRAVKAWQSLHYSICRTVYHRYVTRGRVSNVNVVVYFVNGYPYRAWSYRYRPDMDLLL